MPKAAYYLIIEIVVVPAIIYALPRILPKKYVSDKLLNFLVGAVIIIGLYEIACTLVVLLGNNIHIT